jgi:integrase
VQNVSFEPVKNDIDRWLTPAEETQLMAAAFPWLQEIMVVALHTGMRQGEILALQWQDIDFERGTLMVMHSKNGTRRTLPLTSTVFELLVTRQARVGIKVGFVFTIENGTRVKPRYLVRAFQKAVRRSGIAHVRFHDLRHTFATRLVQRGVDLYRVQRLLGHKTSIMTQRYAHHSPESLREGVRVLEDTEPVRVSTNLAQGPNSGGGQVLKSLT